MDQFNGTVPLKAPGAIGPYLLGRNVAGVFTVCDASTQATLINLRPAGAANEIISCIPLAGAGTILVQGSAAIAADTAIYQAASGQVATTGTLLVGQTTESISAAGGVGRAIRYAR